MVQRTYGFCMPPFVFILSNVSHLTTLQAYLYSQLKAFQIVTVTLMSILAPQMLINIRHEIYHPNFPSHPFAMDTLTWDVSPGQNPSRSGTVVTGSCEID